MKGYDMENKIKNRALTRIKVISIIVKISFYANIIGFIIAIGLMVYIGNSPMEKFEIIEEGQIYSVRFYVKENTYFIQEIPGTYIHEDLLSETNLRKLYLTYDFLSTRTTHLIFIFLLSRLVKILNSVIKLDSPFIKGNVRCIRQVALVIFVRALCYDAYVSFFTTKVVFDRASWSMYTSGMEKEFLLAIVIFIVAEIFSYGIFLQEEYDTTL